ncbi:hypothetical protein FA15DRAFT_704559 [Coprinopsis marcescibilis]|uniref:Uncharacterized protein n=1 Tax=Coprinopsis marcescibilis TaxID=230819 RepID=A0A5C3L879_COPMA|nr:hypothetical protein FA15DRAFT_704559 [Coprinopsis marcescibilis]
MNPSYLWETSSDSQASQPPDHPTSSAMWHSNGGLVLDPRRGECGLGANCPEPTSIQRTTAAPDPAHRRKFNSEMHKGQVSRTVCAEVRASVLPVLLPRTRLPGMYRAQTQGGKASLSMAVAKYRHIPESTSHTSASNSHFHPTRSTSPPIPTVRTAMPRHVSPSRVESPPKTTATSERDAHGHVHANPGFHIPTFGSRYRHYPFLLKQYSEGCPRIPVQPLEQPQQTGGPVHAAKPAYHCNASA